MQTTKGLPRVEVTPDGEGVVSHAGSRLLAELAQGLGLTAGLSEAMAPTRERRSAHDRGKVLIDLAVMLADGGDCLANLATLRNEPGLFGIVASDPTAWRVMNAITKQQLGAIATARAKARAKAWAAGARPEELILDLDATLIDSHSDRKQKAAPTYKGLRLPPGALLPGRDRRGPRRDAAAGKRRLQHRRRPARRGR